MHLISASFRKHCLVPVCALAFATVAFAQQKAERNYQFEDDTAEALNLYRTESEAPTKDHNKLLAILDGQLAKLKDKSGYDYAMVLEFKAKLFIEKGEYGKAIEPMEQGLILSDAHSPTYLEERSSTEICLFLSQLYFQEAINLKNKETILRYYEKSEHYIDRWMKTATKVTEEGLSFYASMLYARATLDDNHPDKDRLVRALELIDRCMHMVSRPKDSLYLYKMACLQQLNRPAESAEIFELLLKRKPENKDYWRQLAGTYIQLEQPTRAIVTLERAQEIGLLNTPTDNYSLFGIYFNEGQFEQAADLLEKGFKENTIENTQLNWELLASCYQQLNRDFKAIDALKRASIFFPKSGQLDFLIAQNYYTMKKLSEALSFLQKSAAKGGGTKPAQTYLLMAYIAYELKKFDVALEAANKAIGFPDGVKEGTRFKKAVQDAIDEREAKLKKM